jgi:hypothetical protein
MEITCPRCQRAVPLEVKAGSFPCPACGTPLEIVAGEGGVILVGIDREAQQRAALTAPPDATLARYTAWQERAAYALAAAGGCGFILFLDVKSSYLNYGYYFWKNPANLVTVYVAGSLCFLFTLGGGILFFWASRKKRRRRELLAAPGAEQQAAQNKECGTE